jgi:hypothetical protein
MHARLHAPDDRFASVLDALAAADGAAVSGLAAEEAWSLLAARIALAMAPADSSGRSSRPDLHLRFVDVLDEAESRPAGPGDDLPEISNHMSRADLERLRRRFAKANHPDRVAPAYREVANRRMAIFNRMIDEALEHSTRA